MFIEPRSMPKYQRFIPYSGSKYRILEELYSHFDTTKSVYVEPFLGSGVVYLNLPFSYEEYIISDYISYIPALINSLFRSFIAYNATRQVIENSFDLEKKEDYYAYRERWNNISSPLMLEKIIGYVMLVGASVNNIVRFGKKGYNQGSGKRKIKDVEGLLERIKNATKPNTHLFNPGGYDFLKMPIQENVFYYLDPPYANTSHNYDRNSEGIWTNLSDEKLVEQCKKIHELGSTFVLSNLMTNTTLIKGLKSFCKIVPIQSKLTYKSSVGKHKKKEHQEIIIKNF